MTAELYCTHQQFDWFQRALNDPLMHDSELVAAVRGQVAAMLLDGAGNDEMLHAYGLIGTPCCPEIKIIIKGRRGPE